MGDPRDSAALNRDCAVVLCANYSAERDLSNNGANDGRRERAEIHDCAEEREPIDHFGTDAGCGLFVDQSDRVARGHLANDDDDDDNDDKQRDYAASYNPLFF